MMVRSMIIVSMTAVIIMPRCAPATLWDSERRVPPTRWPLKCARAHESHTQETKTPRAAFWATARPGPVPVSCPMPADGRRFCERSSRAAPGIEPGTSRTLSENHTTRPSSQMSMTSAVLLKAKSPKAHAGLSRIVGTFGNRAASFRQVGMPTSGRPQLRRATPTRASGGLWEPLRGAFGNLWGSLWGPLYELLGAFGNQVELLGTFGNLWEPPGASGSLWEPLGAFWSLR
jgi:hypothetical protein